ncbi:MAG: hypothetical protein L3J35_01275 [Bacteroidales bacterium]|nr:hypothetical protein [Bacteroidales bacterium]
MLKKAAYYIMTFILLLSVIGITVNKHYSGNKLFSVSLFLEADSCCDNPCDCCSNTSETHSLTDSFVRTFFEFGINSFSYITNTNEIISSLSENTVFSATYKNIKYSANTSPAYLQSFRL